MNLLQNVTKTPVCIVKGRNQWWHLDATTFAAIMWAWFHWKGGVVKKSRALRARLFISAPPYCRSWIRHCWSVQYSFYIIEIQRGQGLILGAIYCLENFLTRVPQLFGGGYSRHSTTKCQGSYLQDRRYNGLDGVFAFVSAISHARGLLEGNLRSCTDFVWYFDLSICIWWSWGGHESLHKKIYRYYTSCATQIWHGSRNNKCV